jgi:WD40 repeat protein
LFDGKADVVDLVLRHYYGACGWDTARLDAEILCVHYGPAGDVIAASDGDGRIHFICAQTGEKILCPRKVDGEVKSVVWSPCGKKMAAACSVETRFMQYDGSVKIFTEEGSAGTFVCQSTPKGHSKDNEECICEFYPNGLLKTSRAECPVRGHSASVNCVDFSPDGLTIASGSGSTFENDNSVRVWDVKTGKQLWQLTGHSDVVSSVHFNPDGTRLVSGSWNNTVMVWDASTGACLSTLKAHSNFVTAVAWSPCGQWLASGGNDNMVYVYDAKTFEVKWPLSGHSAWVESVAWSPDGTKLASGSSDKTVRIWEAATGNQLWQLSGHSEGVNSVSWSPDGAKLASGSYDKTVRIWEVAVSRAAQ